MTKNFQQLGFHQANGKSNCPTEGNWWIFNENKKSFECDICSKKYATKCELKQHVGSSHKEKRPYKCKTCSFRFQYKKFLEKHTNEVHEENIA